MERLNGRNVHDGIVIGKILFYTKAQAAHRAAEDPEAEWARYQSAVIDAKEQLVSLHKKAVREVGEQQAQIFEAHFMMIEDEDYRAAVRKHIFSEHMNAETAVTVTGDEFAGHFAAMEDEFFKARAADVMDVSERLAGIISGNQVIETLKEPGIVVADDLSPSELMQMDRQMLLALVTRQGTANSHTAILARTMDVPVLIGVDIRPEWNGKTAIVDTCESLLIVEPEEKDIEIYRKKQEKRLTKMALLESLKGKEDITKGGQKIRLYANIGAVDDLDAVLQNDAAGIGLFRSEFLYLGRADYPDEETQFAAYKQAAQAMNGKPVIIRTLDIGADKQADYFQLEKEENPAMGLRAIRICLERPDIFRTQLRAILRASVYGNIAVMYPMIISVEEVRAAKQIMEEVKNELSGENISYGNICQGILIETPAAALISDKLAEEVDFFSIGTNDLTQYVLALDRQNGRLDRFCNPHHEAVLRLIGMVVDNAHQRGIWAGICGELAADMSLTETFLEMGVDELSVTPGMILPIREIIRESRSVPDAHFARNHN